MRSPLLLKLVCEWLWERAAIPSRMLVHLTLSDTHIHPLLARIITEHDIDAQLMTSQGGSPPLDVLVRTSGVNRLSDFLLWQVRCSSAVHSVLLLLSSAARTHSCTSRRPIGRNSACWISFLSYSITRRKPGVHNRCHPNLYS
jgi:hypothetical protein